MQVSAIINSHSVGNRIVDSQIQILDGLIYDIDHLILVNHVVALSVAIKLLHESLHHYFVVEENIAQAVGFNFTKHRVAHQRLSNDFLAITDKFTSQPEKHSKIEKREFVDSLRDSLNQHIEVDSKPLKIVLEKHFYDLKPLHGFNPAVSWPLKS